MIDFEQLNRVRQRPLQEWFLIYINEFLEAFVAILLIRVAIDKPLHLYHLIQASAAIGLVTFILENFNSEFKSNVKQGITFSVGSQMISHFMN